jgi:hypothetical protein
MEMLKLIRLDDQRPPGERTALMDAALKDDIGTLQHLLQNGARIGDIDEIGRTAAHFATSAEAVEILLSYGADIEYPVIPRDVIAGVVYFSPGQEESQMERLIHNAASNGHPGLVRFLLDRGVDPSCKTSIGQTPRDCCEDEMNRLVRSTIYHNTDCKVRVGKTDKIDDYKMVLSMLPENDDKRVEVWRDQLISALASEVSVLGVLRKLPSSSMDAFEYCRAFDGLDSVGLCRLLFVMLVILEMVYSCIECAYS